MTTKGTWLLDPETGALVLVPARPWTPEPLVRPTPTKGTWVPDPKTGDLVFTPAKAWTPAPLPPPLPTGLYL